MTKKNVILRALRDAGSEGIHSFHLNHIARTTRTAARINDLKKEGYNITSILEKMGDSYGKRYFLQSVPVKQEAVWEYEGNKAVLKRKEKIVQQTLI